MVVGAPVECDCGGGIRYLKSGVKRDEVGTAKIMLNTDVKDRNFTGRFDSCSAAYAPESKECLRSPLPLWFGAEETVSFGTASAKSFMKDYYDNIQRCQNILTSLFDGSSSPLTGKPLTDFLLAAQRNYVENHRTKGASGFCGDIYRNPHMKNYNDAVGDLNAYQTSIDRIAKNIGISKPFRKPEPMDFSSVPSELPSLQDTLLLELENLLYEAQTHLDAAQGILNGFQSDSFGSPLIDTSVLVCTQGGVISIVDDGQKDSEGNYLHGFSEDLQHIWYGGYKYKVYVPEQPQTKIYKDIVKDWEKVGHETTKHAGLGLYQKIFYSRIYKDFQMIPTSINDGTYDITFDSVAENIPDYPTSGMWAPEWIVKEYEEHQRLNPGEKFVLKHEGIFDTDTKIHVNPNGVVSTYKNTHRISLDTSPPAGSKKAMQKFGMGVIPYIIEAFEKDIVILEIWLDFYIAGGVRLVTIRWHDYQSKKRLDNMVGQIHSIGLYHDKWQRQVQVQRRIESILRQNGFVDAPRYGTPSIGMNEAALSKIHEERESFIREHPDAEILPDFKTWNSPAHSGNYDFYIRLSDKRKKTDELGYLYYNKKNQLMSQDVIYDDEELSVGWSKAPHIVSKYHKLLDIKKIIFPTEPYFIYHYLLYNWVNGCNRLWLKKMQEDLEIIDELMAPNLANEEW